MSATSTTPSGTSNGCKSSTGNALEERDGRWGSLSFEEARGHATKSSTKMKIVSQDGDGPRNLVLRLNGHVGALCRCFCRSPVDCAVGLGAFTRPEKDRVATELASAFALLLILAEQCNVDLALSVQLKIELNAKKYPAVLVRGSALKYDAYQESTGFGKGCKQVLEGHNGGNGHLAACTGRPWSHGTLQSLRVQLRNFAEDREWVQFHTPRNICLALTGEAGELSELFQFRDEEACRAGLPGWSPDERDKLSQELSDVCIYLTRLSDLCGVDLGTALLLSLRDEVPCGDDSYSAHDGHTSCPRKQSHKGERWGLTACLLVGLLAVAVVLTNTKRCTAV